MHKFIIDLCQNSSIEKGLCFSDDCYNVMHKIKKFNYENIYFHPRLKPFKDELEVDCAFSCKKPMRKKYDLILKEYKYSVSEVAMVGDNIVTDILGGNKVGITTILVNPISNKEVFAARISRVIEGMIIDKLTKRELFMKGKYYE